ncbi:MAG: hypothetical protein M8354_09055 [Halalkalicoccus sp.]|nr:hypothetical protein [Halalkalicoccus sp.]
MWTGDKRDSDLLCTRLAVETLAGTNQLIVVAGRAIGGVVGLKAEAVKDQLAEDLNVEQRLEEITQRAIDRIDDSVGDVEETAEDLRDIHARAANYPLVNFRLLIRQHSPPEAWVDEQFKWSRNRLREPLAEHDPFDGLMTSDSGDESSDDSEDRDDGKVTDIDELI